MKKIAFLLACCLLLAGCSLFGSADPQSEGDRSSSAPQSISQPISSVSQPEEDSSSSLPPDSSESSSVPDSSSQAEPATDVSAWVGLYAKQPGSAGQVTLQITEGQKEGTIHFVLDAKGLTVEGDALVYKDGGAICEEQGNMTLSIVQRGISVAEGKPISESVDFSGTYEKM